MILQETIITDTDTNMQSYVYHSQHPSNAARPFAAILKDLDSDRVVDGSIRYYPTLEQAIEKAKEYIK